MDMRDFYGDNKCSGLVDAVEKNNYMKAYIEAIKQKMTELNVDDQIQRQFILFLCTKKILAPAEMFHLYTNNKKKLYDDTQAVFTSRTLTKKVINAIEPLCKEVYTIIADDYQRIQESQRSA